MLSSKSCRGAGMKSHTPACRLSWRLEPGSTDGSEEEANHNLLGKSWFSRHDRVPSTRTVHQGGGWRSMCAECGARHVLRAGCTRRSGGRVGGMRCGPALREPWG